MAEFTDIFKLQLDTESVIAGIVAMVNLGFVRFQNRCVTAPINTVY